MTPLAQCSMIAGALHGAAGLWFLWSPERGRAWLDRVPRSRAAGTVLALLAVGWAAWNLMHSHLGGFEPYKKFVPVAGIMLCMGIMAVMQELLAARMAGALLLLSANPVIRAARFHEDPWTLGLVALAYVWVVTGMAWMLGPWRFRRWAMAALSTRTRGRMVAAVFLLVAAFLGALAYRVA